MNILKSFQYALEGIWHTIKNERNFRIHMVIAAYVLFFSFFYDLTRVEYAVLIIVFAGVMTSEIVNSAIEELINLMVKEYNVMAKHVKDMAAGGVLVFAVGAVVVGFFLFWDTDVLAKMIRTLFASQPLYTVAFLASLFVSCIFIKGEPKKK